MVLQMCIMISILVHQASFFPINITNNIFNDSVGVHPTNLKKLPTIIVQIPQLSFEHKNNLKSVNTTMAIQESELKQKNALEALIERVRLESVGQPDHAIGRLVAAWKPGRSNPEELTLYKHGDILHKVLPDNRGGIMDTNYRWPNGIIYFNISGNFTENQRNKIQKAFDQYHKRTCIKFVQITGSETDFVSIESGPTGCWSSLGRLGGKQVVNLQPPNCLKQVGSILHELMHAVGFFHEQSRMDRDEHVKILWQNVIPGKENNFEKYESLLYGEPYDYESVMHYSAVALSKNNMKTVIPMVKGVTIGQRRGFSRSDIRKIRAMYSCPPMQELPGDEIDDDEDDDDRKT